MSDSLGLSIGMTNLVAARMGRPPVMRRSVLTVFDDRAPEVGVPAENPNLNQPGMVLSGFVERVGDPVPLVAADGSPHRGERVLVEALDAMARTVGGGTPVVIAVPAHWGQGDRRRTARGVGSDTEPGARRCGPGTRSRTRSRPFRRCRPRRGCRRMVLWCFAISVEAGPASRWRTRHRASPLSARRCAMRSSRATRSTRLCSITWWPVSPMPVTPIPRALPPSARWPGCATTAGWPRNSCPPRPRPRYTPSFPGSPPTSG